MFIGVCFFGRIRHFDKKYFLNSFGANHTYHFFYSGDNEPEELVAEFQKLYAPISISNEKLSYTIDFGIYPNNKTCPANIDNMTRHLLNKKRVFGLLEEYCAKTQTSYDLIVSCRFDLRMDAYSPDLPLENTIYIPEGNDYMGINDRFAMGDIQTMKHYMNLYDNCVYLLEKGLSVPHPECLHASNLLHCNLNTQRIKLPQSIVR